ncbi:caspase-1-A-like [Solea senegalensis]|uniref:Caspase-1-A-like n=1 Tax=Solea senegalensis TaxID=28829 RepID=A0AAV6PX77_SOLSE|nr:caspase a-like isoform X2 [Solea senegalensis]KAG7478878.1 caspase-1-A-like [Solea senegalensis]
MTDALVKVRSKFVDKVSKELINQLLDDLLEDRILNDGEKDSIIEDHSSRANRARCLIDTVKKKGNIPSQKMIDHIQTRDPTLYCELGLSCGNRGNPNIHPSAAETKSDTLVPITEAFWREKQNNREIYPVTKANMGSRVALLITNITFRVEKYNRNGAKKDEENMERLLTELGYEVVKHTDLTAKAIDRALIDFSALPKLKATDSVVVVIMSHGKLGIVHGVEWKLGDENPDEFPINNLYRHLGSKECPALLNKPKIIIIQACRGEHSGSVFVSDGPSVSDGGDIKEDTLQVVHREKDFISLLSCTPDTVSYRHTGQGSFLIQYIVSQFNKTAHEDDVEELFRKVMQQFEDNGPGNRKQMPTKDRCTLTKRFYFFPGLNAL